MSFWNEFYTYGNLSIKENTSLSEQNEVFRFHEKSQFKFIKMNTENLKPFYFFIQFVFTKEYSSWKSNFQIDIHYQETFWLEAKGWPTYFVPHFVSGIDKLFMLLKFESSFLRSEKYRFRHTSAFFNADNGKTLMYTTLLQGEVDEMLLM